MGSALSGAKCPKSLKMLQPVESRDAFYLSTSSNPLLPLATLHQTWLVSELLKAGFLCPSGNSTVETRNAILGRYENIHSNSHGQISSSKSCTGLTRKALLKSFQPCAGRPPLQFNVNLSHLSQSQEECQWPRQQPQQPQQPRARPGFGDV